jgi:hypothetical protein
MKNILFVVTLFIGMNNSAFAEALQLVQYADAPAHLSTDAKPAAPSLGDVSIRQGAFKATVDGPVIGEYFAQTTIVSLNATEKQVIMSEVIESVYLDGSIYKMDVIVLEDGKLLEDGHKHVGAIVGGTGKYAGARGSYEFEMLKGGDYKITNTYWLGQ